MFGFRSPPRRSRGGTFSTGNLTRAALAGAGLLAARWWRNRRAADRGASRPEEQPEVRTSSARTF